MNKHIKEYKGNKESKVNKVLEDRMDNKVMMGYKVILEWWV